MSFIARRLRCRHPIYIRHPKKNDCEKTWLGYISCRILIIIFNRLVASWYALCPAASITHQILGQTFPSLMSEGFASVGRTAIGRRELKPCILSVWVACKFTCTVLHLRAVAWKIWGETERDRDRDRERNRSWKHCDVIWSESETWYPRGYIEIVLKETTKKKMERKGTRHINDSDATHMSFYPCTQHRWHPRSKLIHRLAHSIHC